LGTGRGAKTLYLRKQACFEKPQAAQDLELYGCKTWFAAIIPTPAPYSMPHHVTTEVVFYSEGDRYTFTNINDLVNYSNPPANRCSYVAGKHDWQNHRE
jgi:hypothetical protein